MKAILLAAGLGTRLRPLTDHLPKCLVPVGGRPLLEHWLTRLSAVGVSEFLINTHYLADAVHRFVEASPFRSRITLAYEEKLHGTAGTLSKQIDFFGAADGLLIHADNFCLANFGQFFASHQQRPARSLMTMMTFDAHDPTQCGIVQTDSEGLVCSFHEKQPNPPGTKANAAIYLLSHEFILRFRQDFSAASDFSTQVIPHLVGRISTFHTHDAMIDVGTPEGYARANEAANFHLMPSTIAA